MSANEGNHNKSNVLVSTRMTAKEIGKLATYLVHILEEVRLLVGGQDGRAEEAPLVVLLSTPQTISTTQEQQEPLQGADQINMRAIRC